MVRGHEGVADGTGPLQALCALLLLDGRGNMEEAQDAGTGVRGRHRETAAVRLWWRVVVGSGECTQ